MSAPYANDVAAVAAHIEIRPEFANTVSDPFAFVPKVDVAPARGANDCGGGQRAILLLKGPESACISISRSTMRLSSAAVDRRSRPLRCRQAPSSST